MGKGSHQGIHRCRYVFTHPSSLTTIFLITTCHFFLDIAAVSIEQARDRYNTLRPPKFKAHFYATDCYSLPLSSSLPQHLVQEVFPPHGPEFDVVSMQFCMHYAFESEEKARTMLNNVSRWLKKGGQFVGTIPNAGQLL